MAEATKRVKLKSNGQEMVISAGDFNEKLHEEIGGQSEQRAGQQGQSQQGQSQQGTGASGSSTVNQPGPGASSIQQEGKKQ